MKKYLAELIGTFTMVFCGTGSIIINEQTGGAVTHVGIAITFGLVVMSTIYSIGNISGSHINPAVTLAFAIGKKFPFKEVLPYLIAQFGGALLASSSLKYLFPEDNLLGATLPHGSDSQAFILELLLTFFLMFTIIQVSHGSKENGIMAGIAIGSVVLFEAMFAGPITGASMNPARSVAPAIVSGHLEHLWVYIAAPFSGAILATIICDFLNNKSSEIK